MQSPILYHRIVKESNGSYVIDDKMPAEIGGSYLTNYFLLKPQKNFHRPVTVTLPLKNGAKILPNHTYHIFVASHEFAHHVANENMMDKAIVQGWGFVNHKKNPIQVLKTENESDKLQFQTDVGGIFVAAQFDWENDPYIHYGHTEISSGSKFWYAILIILLIICSTILVWRFWCRRHDKVSGPAVEFMESLNYFKWRNLRGGSTVI